MPPIDKQTCNELKENLNPWILQFRGPSGSVMLWRVFPQSESFIL